MSQATSGGQQTTQLNVQDLGPEQLASVKEQLDQVRLLLFYTSFFIHIFTPENSIVINLEKENQGTIPTHPRASS